jgi:hypothetical protein
VELACAAYVYFNVGLPIARTRPEIGPPMLLVMKLPNVHCGIRNRRVATLERYGTCADDLGARVTSGGAHREVLEGT